MAGFNIALYCANTDKQAANEKFARNMGIDFPILTDRGKKTARAYGVLKLGLYAARTTFVIDAAGNIVKVLEKVTPKSAGEDLARALEELRS